MARGEVPMGPMGPTLDDFHSCGGEPPSPEVIERRYKLQALAGMARSLADDYMREAIVSDAAWEGQSGPGIDDIVARAWRVASAWYEAMERHTRVAARDLGIEFSVGGL